MLLVHSRCVVACWVSIFFTTTMAQAETLEEALDAFAQSSESIRTYSVSLQTTRIWWMKEDVVGKKTIRGREVPIIALRELVSGEQPKIDVRSSWQFSTRDGKRKLTRFEPDSSEVEGIKAFDGKIQRKWSGMNGSIGPMDRIFIVNGEDYCTFFRCVQAGGPLVDIFRNRKTTRLIVPDKDDADHLVIESPPEAGTTRPKKGWRVWLDRRHGMMPSRIDMFDKSMETLYCQTLINKFHEIKSKHWAPIDVTLTWFDKKQRKDLEIHNVVNVARSKWNELIADDEFTFPFPIGARIHNKILGVSYVVGPYGEMTKLTPMPQANRPR